jgi:hypothetical protein
MPRFVGQTSQERAVTQSRYVAQLYISRKKVWEGRAGSYEEASNLANHEKSKYPGAKSSVVIKESKTADA